MSHPDPDLLAATRPLVAAFEHLGAAYFVGGSDLLARVLVEAGLTRPDAGA